MAIVTQVGNYVKFLRGTPNAFAQLVNKDSDTLYFISEQNADRGVLYLGDKLISGGISTATSLSDLSDVLIGSGVSAGSLLYFNGTRWIDKSLAEIFEIIVGNMVGATQYDNGQAGLVPAPQAGQQNLYLRGDATWANPTATIQSQVNTLETQVGTLVNNDTNKSVRTIAAEEVQKIVDGAPEALNTLSEIATYIIEHPDSAELVTRVQNLETTVNAPNTGLVSKVTIVQQQVGSLEDEIQSLDYRVTNIENDLKWQHFYVE